MPIMLLYEIFHMKRNNEPLTDYLTGKLRESEAIQTVNLFSSDLSHTRATCNVTSSLLAYKSHRDAGLACNSLK